MDDIEQFEDLHNQYNTNESLKKRSAIKKHNSSNFISSNLKLKLNNPIFKQTDKKINFKMERQSIGSFSSKGIVALIKGKLKLESNSESELKEDKFNINNDDSDSDDSIIETSNKMVLSQPKHSTFENLNEKINESYNHSTILENEIKFNEKDDLEISFLEYFLDIQFNTEDNYENYVYSSLKASYYFPKDIDWDKEISLKKVFLPPSEKDKTLFLDLDETLIHCDIERQLDKYDLILMLENQQLPIMLRPFLKEFLNTIINDFELVIFTASNKEYADTVIDAIDPENKFFSYRLYRQSNIFIKHGIYVKDLRIIQNRDLKKCVLVENNLLSFINQLSNGILVPSFFNNPNDNYLTCLLGYLKNEILYCEDVQKINDESFGFENMKLEVQKL